jgi:LysR family glycine cleavage system transcriptional activator
MADGPPILHPADCLNYPLLHDAIAADWRLWLQAFGANHRDPRTVRGTRFSDATLLLGAAIAGQGLALLRDAYVEQDIAAGRLRIAIHAAWPAEFTYYVVTNPRAGSRSSQVGCFREWLLREAANGM